MSQTKKTTIRIPIELYRRVEEARKRHPFSTTQVCVDALEAHLESIESSSKSDSQNQAPIRVLERAALDALIADYIERLLLRSEARSEAHGIQDVRVQKVLKLSALRKALLERQRMSKEVVELLDSYERQLKGPIEKVLKKATASSPASSSESAPSGSSGSSPKKLRRPPPYRRRRKKPARENNEE